MRWSIEEFFRLLKTAGFDIEETDIGDPQAMIKFVRQRFAVTVMQLVARDGTTDRSSLIFQSLKLFARERRRTAER